MTDPMQSFSEALLDKRAELDHQIATGDITLDEAETALGQWYDEHAPGAGSAGLMSGSHECPYCHYRFEDAESLRRHLEEGDGCPETP